MKLHTLILTIAIASWISGCIFPPNTSPNKPTPEITATAKPTPRPTLPPPIPPYDIPTPDTTEFLILNAPEKVNVGSEILLVVRAKEHDSVNVWVDQFQVGKMLWQANARHKYLRFKLSSPGERTLSFKVNGQVIHSQPLSVLERE